MFFLLEIILFVAFLDKIKENIELFLFLIILDVVFFVLGSAWAVFILALALLWFVYCIIRG